MKINAKILGIVGVVGILVIVLIVIGIVLMVKDKKEEAAEQKPNVTTPIEENPTERPIERPTEEQNDANSGGDVTAEIESPHPVGYGEWKGTLTEDDYGDAYGIRWNPGDTIDIVITPSKGLDVDFYARSGGRYLYDAGNKGFKGETESIKMTSDITSHYKRADFLISTVSGSGDYTLKITATPQNDGNSGKDAPRCKDEKQPPVVSTGKYEGCYLGSYDDADLYAVKLKKGQTATVVVTPSKELDVGLDVSRTAGDSPYDEINDNFSGESEEIKREADTTGIYYIAVTLVGETEGTYTLEISVR